jgi:RNA polymerase sigma factor (sigma-70 family)
VTKSRGRPRKERPPKPSREERHARKFLRDPDRLAVVLVDALLKLERGTARACVRVVAAVTKRNEATLRAKQSRRCRSADERHWREQYAELLASAIRDRFLEAAEIVPAGADFAAGGGLKAEGWHHIERRPDVEDEEPESAPARPAKSNPELARRRELGRRFPCTLQHLRDLVQQYYDTHGGAVFVLREEGTALPWRYPQNDRHWFAHAKEVRRHRRPIPALGGAEVRVPVGPPSGARYDDQLRALHAKETRVASGKRWVLTFPIPKFNPPSPPAGVITKIPPWKTGDGWHIVDVRPSAPAHRIVPVFGPYRALDETATRHISGIARRNDCRDGPLGGTTRGGAWSLRPRAVVEILHFESWGMCTTRPVRQAPPRDHQWLTMRYGWNSLAFAEDVAREVEGRLVGHGSRENDEWIATVERGLSRGSANEWIKRIAKRIARTWGLPLPWWVNGTKYMQHVDIDDLKQQGWLGLLETKRTYDPSHGPVSKSYVVKFIEAEIWELLRLSSSAMSVPKNFKAYRDYLDSGKFPRLVHLDEVPDARDQDPDDSVDSLHEKVAGPDAVPTSALAERTSAWDHLDAREREVVQLRARLSAKQVAVRMHIDKATVHRILAGAIEKLSA